ncbi:membrane-associated protein [Goodfellowiella coeruleoviolacea]|uniref:Membrane-associated protein n=1 Tax=Goodfellowiella coeruleoviolacea TaxID=334858 RepID=A0AAE3KPT4_9PSEU|nr:membrane-associated protein [Goodfellowiella coeruleoviolacea]
MGGFFNDLVARFDAVPPAVVVVLVLGIMVLETSVLVGLVVPGDVAVVFAAAVLPVRWAVLIAAVAFAGTLLGQSGGYLLGRTVGPAIRAGWLGRRIGPDRWRRAEELANGPAARAMVSTRFVAVLHSLVPIMAGCVGMGYARFLRITTLGAAVWAVLWTGVGVLARQAGLASGHPGLGLVFALLGLAVSAVIAHRVVRAERARAAAVQRGVITRSKEDVLR